MKNRLKAQKKVIRRSKWTFKILTNRICVKCFVKIKWNSYLQTARTRVKRYCIQLHWMTGLFEWYIGMKNTILDVKVECLVAWQQPAFMLQMWGSKSNWDETFFQICHFQTITSLAPDKNLCPVSESKCSRYKNKQIKTEMILLR